MVVVTETIEYTVYRNFFKLFQKRSPLKRHSNGGTETEKHRSAVHCLAVRPFSARVPLPLFLRRGRMPSWSSETLFYTASAIAKTYDIECCQKEPSISALAFGCGAVVASVLLVSRVAQTVNG